MMHNPPQIYGAPLFAAVPDSENLLTAWEKIDENAAGLGLNGVSLKVFGAALEEELTRLSHALHIVIPTKVPSATMTSQADSTLFSGHYRNHNGKDYSKAKKLIYRSPVTWEMWSFLLMIRTKTVKTSLGQVKASPKSRREKAISGQQNSCQQSAISGQQEQ